MKKKYSSFRILGMLLLIILIGLSGCSNVINLEDSKVKESVVDMENSEKSQDGKIDSEDINADIQDDAGLSDHVFEGNVIETRSTFMIEGKSSEDIGSKTPIYTLTDLENVSQKGDYILMTDIDCLNSKYSISHFEGTFEGNYHQLINRSNALFESIDGGSVQNLAIIETTSNTAGLVNEFTKGNITNCYVTGEIGKNKESDSLCGGLVQYVFGEKCYIDRCFNIADIYNVPDGFGGEPDYGVAGAGGIVGSVRYNGYSQRDVVAFGCNNCENYGTIHIDGRRSAGGICGTIYVGENGPLTSYSIWNCSNYGIVKLYDDESEHNSIVGIGGIVGKIMGRTNHADSHIGIEIACCTNNNLFYLKDNSNVLGGICGSVELNAWENAPITISIHDCLNACRGIGNGAGICHSLDLCYTKMFISNCIDLSGSNAPVYQFTRSYNPQQQGDLSVKNCFYLKYDNDTNLENAVGLEEEEMRNKDSFPGFFEDGTWWMDAEVNNGYPYLLK